MTKYYSCLLIILFVLFSCNSEKAPDCFMASGSIVTNEITTPDFSWIDVGEGIEMIVKQGSETKILVETGANLLQGISVSVSDDKLFLRNGNGCSWFRDKNITKVYVTVPDLKGIYSASQFNISSNGVLHFDDFAIRSGMYSDTASGIFDLQLECTNLVVEDNQASLYRISGKVTNLSIAFYSGAERFEGQNLMAQQVWVFQRSTNDIIVNPQQEIKGDIYSTGNVVLKNNPSLVEIAQHYTGHVVYN
ncbi:head GIN domain-containing protein [Flavobacterium sp.]|uniref:head GIN domain-containing protein n=1 Tax=Flavobacterium sp. TaxID=239 RepID=UPI00262297CA|nr:head GIN domain-containing protein [Flavobacterium sp.]